MDNINHSPAVGLSLQIRDERAGYCPTVCIHQPPRSAMWNTYAFARSGSYRIRPLATRSTATGNEVFGSVLSKSALVKGKRVGSNIIVSTYSQTLCDVLSTFVDYLRTLCQSLCDDLT
jgi:hypothetical protein